MGRRPRPPPRPRPLPRPRPPPRYRPPPRPRPPPRYRPPPRPRPIRIDPCGNYRNQINQKNNQINQKNNQINQKNALITGLNYKIAEYSKTNNFYKDKMYGKGNELGFLKILTKNNKKLEYFNNINNIEGMSTIEGLTVSEKELKTLINENKLLDSQIQETKNNYTADDTQVFYKQQEFIRQKDMNFVLFVIFYTLILGLAIYLFLFNTKTNIYLKIFTTIMLAIYPFIIEYIEFALYFITYYLYALIHGTTFDINNYYGFTFRPAQSYTI